MRPEAEAEAAADAKAALAAWIAEARDAPPPPAFPVPAGPSAAVAVPPRATRVVAAPVTRGG